MSQFVKRTFFATGLAVIWLPSMINVNPFRYFKTPPAIDRLAVTMYAR
jgi:hypothetical protein